MERKERKKKENEKLKMEICYFCGNEATTIEHVPPESFFPQNMKDQLITVPSCKVHNSGFSKLDERCRVYFVGMSSSESAVNVFKDKIERSLNRDEAQGFISSLKEEHQLLKIGELSYPGIVMEQDYITKFIEKLVRGIYYYHIKKPSSGQIIFVYSHDPDSIELYKEFEAHFNNLYNFNYFTKGYCCNEKIFLYYYFKRGNNYFFDIVFYNQVRFMIKYKM